MSLTTAEAEDLQAKIHTHLRIVDRTGDVERIAQRIALKHSRGARVVGFRQGGRELFLHEDGRAESPNTLAIYEVGREGRLSRTGTVWKGKDLEAWLDEHRFFFEWIAPEWR